MSGGQRVDFGVEDGDKKRVWEPMKASRNTDLARVWVCKWSHENIFTYSGLSSLSIHSSSIYQSHVSESLVKKTQCSKQTSSTNTDANTALARRIPSNAVLSLRLFESPKSNVV